MMHSLKILGAAAGATVLFATASVAGTPVVVLTPAFTEKTSDVLVPAAKDPSACTVTVAALSDERRDPKTVGIVVDRAVQSPDDTQAWMRAIVGGLAARGVTPQFDTPAQPAGSAAPVARFGLKTVWLTPVNTDFSSDVIMSVDATAPDGRVLKKTYRGQVTVLNWNSGVSEMQTAITRAFSDALNKMAPDLKAICQKPSM